MPTLVGRNALAPVPSRRAFAGWYLRRVVADPAGPCGRYRETGEIWAFADHHYQRPLFVVVRADTGLLPLPRPARPAPTGAARERLQVFLAHEAGAAERM